MPPRRRPRFRLQGGGIQRFINGEQRGYPAPQAGALALGAPAPAASRAPKERGCHTHPYQPATTQWVGSARVKWEKLRPRTAPVTLTRCRHAEAVLPVPPQCRGTLVQAPRACQHLAGPVEHQHKAAAAHRHRRLGDGGRVGGRAVPAAVIDGKQVYSKERGLL